MERIKNTLLSDVIGLEAMNPEVGNPDMPMQPLQNFSAETVSNLNLITRKYKKPAFESIGHISEGEILKEMRAQTSEAYSRAAREYSTQAKKYATLPNEVKRMLDPLRANYVALESEQANLGSDRTSVQARMVKYKKDQTQMAMESMLFQMLSNVDSTSRAFIPRDIDRMGMESYTYQNAIFYPKLEAMVQWVNVAATIYQKVMKVKQLLNVVTEIPVHTQKVTIQYTDDNGKVKKEVSREKLYSKFVHDDIPEAYPEQKKTFKLEVTDGFNYYIDLTADKVWTPVLGSSKVEAITGKESLRTDFMITEVGFADGQKLGKVYDQLAGKMQTMTYTEVDAKGKTLELVHPTDKASNDKKKVHTLGIHYDAQNKRIKFSNSKGTGATSEIQSITVEFKIVDFAMEVRANKRYKIVTERGMITAGAFRREVVPLNQSELEILDQRMQGSFLNKITNLCAESIVQNKDNTFYKETMAMAKDLKEAFTADPDFQLFTEQTVDMGLENSVMKAADLNVYLGSTFQNIVQTYNSASNTQSDVQVNLFCHSLALSPINPAIKHIAGEVTEVSNNQFMGVQQDARVSVLTLGHDTSTPVSSIVVGTDKLDMKPKRAVTGLPGDTEYEYHIIPTFAETNLETVMFTETPTRVISDNAIRSVEYPMIPAMIMDYSATVSVLRPAYGKLTVKGYHIHTV